MSEFSNLRLGRIYGRWNEIYDQLDGSG